MKRQKILQEPVLLWIVLPLSLFIIFGIANNSLVIQTPQEVKKEILTTVGPLLWEKTDIQTKLYAWWDIMLSRGVGYYNKMNNWERMFETDSYNPIHEWCQDDCFLIFNLESLFSTTPNDEPDPTYHFAANTRNIDILHRMKGYNQLYISLANNHARNVGKDGVMFTRKFLTQEKIFYGGAGEDISVSGYNVTIIDRDGIRICLSSYTYDGATIGKWNWQYTIEKLDIWRIQRDVIYMDEQDCDVKVANLHRWREYRMSASLNQKVLAREVIDSGIDLILGNHSHVPWPIEQYKGKYIVYSMGNHIFDQDRGYKTCDKDKYDTIFDYALKRCTVPTYIGFNLGFLLEKNNDTTTISLDQIKFFGIKRGIQYQLDEKTTEEFKWQIFILDDQ